jgi:hypothetical protein
MTICATAVHVDIAGDEVQSEHLFPMLIYSVTEKVNHPIWKKPLCPIKTQLSAAADPSVTVSVWHLYSY